MERSAEVEAFAEVMYELMRAGDPDGTAALIADEGALFVGTDAAEWWDSSEVSKRAFREQMEASGGFDIRSSGDLVGFVDGDVGWVADRPVMRIGDNEVTMRMTTVLLRTAGGWRVVQGHLSVAANVNDELFD